VSEQTTPPEAVSIMLVTPTGGGESDTLVLGTPRRVADVMVRQGALVSKIIRTGNKIVTGAGWKWVSLGLKDLRMRDRHNNRSSCRHCQTGATDSAALKGMGGVWEGCGGSKGVFKSWDLCCGLPGLDAQGGGGRLVLGGRQWGKTSGE